MLGYQVDLPPKEAYEKARIAAERALALDPGSAEAHGAFATYLWAVRDFPKAEAEYRRTLELNPNLSLAHEYYSWFLTSAGRFPEALLQSQRALELDPLSLGENSWQGQIYLYAHDFDKAIAEFTRILEVDPNYANAHLAMAEAYLAKGMCQQAQEQSSIYMTLAGYPKIGAYGKQVYDKSGCRGFLQARIHIQDNPAEMEFYYPYQVAEDYARLGDKDKAISWLERCFNEGVGMNFVKYDPPLIACTQTRATPTCCAGWGCLNDPDIPILKEVKAEYAQLQQSWRLFSFGPSSGSVIKPSQGGKARETEGWFRHG